MPAVRNVPLVRRSRRLSKAPPQNGLDWEAYDLVALEQIEQTPEPATPPHLDATRLSRAIFIEEVLASCPAVADLFAAGSGRAVAKRSAHAGRRKEGHIPAPTERVHDLSLSYISRIAGILWNQLSAAQQDPYRDVAERAKRIHRELHPDYKYAPVSRRERGPKRKVSRDAGDDERRCKKVAELIRSGVEGDALEKRMIADSASSEDVVSSSSSGAHRRVHRPAKSSAPYSRSGLALRRIQTSPLPVKSESPTPAPLFASSPASVPAPSPTSTLVTKPAFVSIADIPPLDLSAPGVATPIEKPQEDAQQSEGDLRPDHLQPGYVNPMFTHEYGVAGPSQPAFSFSSNVQLHPDYQLHLPNNFMTPSRVPDPTFDAAYYNVNVFSHQEPVIFSDPWADDSTNSSDDPRLYALDRMEEILGGTSLMTPPLPQHDDLVPASPEDFHAWINYDGDA
ncbi:hypothetical protein EWM64_g1653 [Hericium alpestre]|uniref:HMG box domain-containing protein n=1 Tax=Hericium alpestre TaxID=135208 RepID=A0A4Z0A8V8_9AGAM|nr:hypothetical protein EWM64_g1653 [Hericium alpestre]